MATDQKHPVPIWNVTKPYISLDCALGEGPYFEADQRTFRFVDIIGKKIHRFHVDRGASSLQSFDTEDAVGVTADIEGDHEQLIVAAKYGFALMNRDGGRLKYLAKTYEDPSKSERMRFNDGAIDPEGRFLAGSMTDQTVHEVEREGALFRLEPTSSSWTATTMLTPLTIPNGLGWSRDGRTMYHTDSPTNTIWAYDYDTTRGMASNRRPWFVLKHADETPGQDDKASLHDAEMPPDLIAPGSVPDGFAIDETGDVWSAVYGASAVLRIRDMSGQGVVVGIVRFPAANITCPRFVDEDLIVTTAQGKGEHGGALFRVHVGVRGRQLPRWKKTVATPS